MEEEEFAISNSRDGAVQLHKDFEEEKVVAKRCLPILGTISGQSNASANEDNLDSIKVDGWEALTESFSSIHKETITKDNSAINDESNTCGTIPLTYSYLATCEKKLLETTYNEDLGSEQILVDNGKLLQVSKKLKLLSETISTPPSALREQISMLRKEMNEAYEFHDLEIQILKGESKADAENSTELIEKYSTLRELYTSLKSEYEEYRKDQEKIRNELQSNTVNCLESLCSQIEASDNSLSDASIVSFNTDFKSSTMIGNLIEEETTLLHDVTIQSRDPLSDTDVFKTPKLTPFKSPKKLFPQILIQRSEGNESECNTRLMELETALRDKASELIELEQRLFKIEDLSGIIHTEFERISSTISKENNTLKENLFNKSEQLDTITQKLFTEIISLNSALEYSLADTPGTKLLPIFIETIMEKCRNIQDKLIMKFNIEKSEWETKMKDLKEENKSLNEQINFQMKEQALKKEIEMPKNNDSNMRQMQDLELAREDIARLEADLSLAENQRKEAEDKCYDLEKAKDSFRLELEKFKHLYETTQNESCKLNEHLSEITSENCELKGICERLKHQLSENEVIINTRVEEKLNLKNREIKEMKAELAQTDEIALKLKAELFATESEKLKFEKRCMELEETNTALQTLIATKDAILKDLERFKSSSENEWEKMKQQIKEKELRESDIKMELDGVTNKYLCEVKKNESLNETIKSRMNAFEELRKSYEDLKKKLLDAENKILLKEEEIQILRSHESDSREIQSELVSAKKAIERLEADLLLADSHGKEVDDHCQELEKNTVSLSLDLEKIKASYLIIEIENEELKKVIHENEKKFESLFEILQKGKKTLTDLLSSSMQTENVAFKLIAEQISSSPGVVKLIESIVEYFNIEWEAKQSVLIENLQNEIKTINERMSEITGENDSLQEICEKLKSNLTETENIISLRNQEILDLRNETAILMQEKAELGVMDEKLLKLKDEMLTMGSEKLKIEKRCRELEDMITTLKDAILVKDATIKNLETSKDSYKYEYELLKQEVITNEDIIRNLKIELDELKKKCDDEIKKSEIDNILFALQVRCERLKEIFGLENCSDMNCDDLLKLLVQNNSPISETEKRFLIQIVDTVFYVQTKLLREWEVHKNNDCILLNDLQSETKRKLSLAKKKYKVKVEKMKEEKLEYEKRWSELQDVNFNLRSEMMIKDANLNELRDMKLFFESDSMNMKERAQKSEALIINLKSEMNRAIEKFSEEVKKLNDEKVNLEKRCSELEDFNRSLQSAMIIKDNNLKDLECFKFSHEGECQHVKRQIQDKEEIISNLKTELFSMKKNCNEEISKVEDEKLKFEQRYSELEEKSADLQALIKTKDKALKDMELFKSLKEKEYENIKLQMKEKEEIIANLKNELDEMKKKYNEEIKKSEIDNMSSALQVSCEKLKDIVSLGKCSSMDSEDLFKLLTQSKSPDTKAESRILKHFIVTVVGVRTKLLQEWEIQKNNDFRLIKELENKISNLQRRDVDIDVKPGRDKVGEKIFDEEVLFDELADLEKIKSSSVKDFPKLWEKVMINVKKIQSRFIELREENEKLDEECDSYAKVIKDLKKEAAMEWKKNNEKTRSLEAEILRLTDIKNYINNEKQELSSKISKVEEECQKLKFNIAAEGAGRGCGCGVDLKKVNELKRTILVKEQKLLDLQDLEAQNISYKSQIEYLKNVLDKERKKTNEEREKLKKLQYELNEATKSQKVERKNSEGNEILEELRMRGSISGGIVQEIVDKEKMRKLSKDVGVLKEICRARYAEIKRLEAENAALKSSTQKNLNQMDSPIRTRGHNKGSKSVIIEKWKTEIEDKENRAV